MTARAELLRRHDADGRPQWFLDVIDADTAGAPIRYEVATRADMRSILADAAELERRGIHVDRSGLARPVRMVGADRVSP